MRGFNIKIFKGGLLFLSTTGQEEGFGNVWGERGVGSYVDLVNSIPKVWEGTTRKYINTRRKTNNNYYTYKHRDKETQTQNPTDTRIR